MTKIFEIMLKKLVLNWYYFGLKVIRSYKITQITPKREIIFLRQP